jgi:pSer/pThr/pTyr-binding forkhead associated (FHA) protein
MTVILKSISHPAMGDVKIESPFFPIGRAEFPFASYGDSVVSRLATRHARLFQERGITYLIDLGSQSGTSINGHPLRKQMAQLHNGDEVCFANELLYKVELFDAKGTIQIPAVAQPTCDLTLVPDHDNTGITPIVVTHLPFLIGKETEAFSPYKKDLPDKVKYLSRYHAIIYSENGNLFIEDLGSTNGTFVAGVRLGEQSELLLHGDLITFGANPFIYKLRLSQEEENAQKETHEEIPSELTGTISMAAADSFLDAFYRHNGNQLATATETPSNSAKHLTIAERKPGSAISRPSKWKKVSVVLKNGKKAIIENQLVNRRRIWQTASISALFLLVLAGMHFKGATEREIKELLDQEQYLASASMANDYLAKHPDAKEINDLATEALLKYVVPNWTKKLTNQQFADAEILLANAKQHSDHNDYGQKILESMDWISQLEKFVANREAESIIIFKQEEQLEALLKWWDKDSVSHRHLLGRISHHVPAFDQAYSQVFSHLRTLRSDASTYLSAIKKLKKTIQQKLTADRAEDLISILQTFAKKYPKLGGIEPLQNDLQNYLKLYSSIQKKNLNEVLSFLESTQFDTPPFQIKMAHLKKNVLPSTAIIKDYQNVSKAWQSGAFDRALKILEKLTDKTWGEIASYKLERYRKIVNDFRLLKTAEGTADFEKRLLYFYSSLTNDDAFFLNAIKKDLGPYKERKFQDVKASFQLAEQYWYDFQQNDGIKSLLRVEDEISTTYKEQAQRLSKAYQHAREGIYVCRFLKLECPGTWKKLHNTILSELKRQHQWLADLNIVLDPALLNKKLQLLAQLPQEKIHEPQ